MVSLDNGIYGEGIGQMATQCGAEVHYVKCGVSEVFSAEEVTNAIRKLRPKLVTAVHCDTPSGTAPVISLGVLNPIDYIGKVCRETDALFYVDFVSSAGGCEVRVDDWAIDIGLLGSQKALSCPPGICALTVSQRAWTAVKVIVSD